MKRSVPYQPILIDQLKDKEIRIGYLNAALEDEDPRVLFIAIKNVMEAEGKSVSELSKKSGLNRENLYRILSGQSDPIYSSVQKILKALGYENSLKHC